MTLRARTDACRTIAFWTALLLDEADHHPDPAHRAVVAGHVALLTPVAKSFFTELGHRSADEALQVWGGYGYLHAYGIEQTVRDSRIAMVYEGTNEIQAIDLVQRKLQGDGGARARALITELALEAARCEAAPALQPFGRALQTQLTAWAELLAALHAEHVDDAGDAEYPLRVADDVLAGVGHALMAWAWARIARVALSPGEASAASGGRSAASWLESARFGLEWLLPQAQVHWGRALQRQASLPFLAA